MTTTSTTIRGPSYNQYIDEHYSGTSPVTSISADITFNSMAPAVNGVSTYFNMINAHFTDGTSVYIGIHEPGTTFPGTTFAQGSVDLAAFAASSTGTVTSSSTPMNGSNTYSFTDGGLPSYRLYNGNMPIVAGHTYTVTMDLENNNLYGYITDKATGVTMALGSINNIGETSFTQNQVNPGHEFTGNYNSSLEPSDDVVINNFQYNGSTVGAYTSKNGVPYYSGQDQSAVGNPIGTQVTREVANNYMETASGTGGNIVHLAASDAAIIGGNSNSGLQLNSTYHNLISVNLTNVPILDMNGQNATMTVAEYNGFTTFLNGSAGISLFNAGSLTLNSGVSNYTLAAGTNTIFMNDTALANATITSTLGNGTDAVFAGTASQYTVASDSSGITVTGSVGGHAGVYHFNQVTELTFSDTHEFVASTAAPAGGQLSSAQVTELYSAVLARQPDVAGLAYYEGLAVTSPSTPFLQYAENFLSSPEYTTNTAHNYAQTAAGDAQFITDSYNNLLHRGPEAGAVDWYEANIIAPALKGLTAGTAAYTQAELQAHAQVLVGFSQSAEFLGDVSITATNPASTTHWLQLV